MSESQAFDLPDLPDKIEPATNTSAIVVVVFMPG
jgi:hypothetical protein